MRRANAVAPLARPHLRQFHTFMQGHLKASPSQPQTAEQDCFVDFDKADGNKEFQRVREERCSTLR